MMIQLGGYQRYVENQKSSLWQPALYPAVADWSLDLNDNNGVEVQDLERIMDFRSTCDWSGTGGRRRSSYFRSKHRSGSSLESEPGSCIEDLLSVSGHAYLCFLCDGSVFHGRVISDKTPVDDRYRLVGRRLGSGPPGAPGTCECSPAERAAEPEWMRRSTGQEDVYQVDVFECDDVDNMSPVHISRVERSGATRHRLCLQTPPPPSPPSQPSSPSHAPPSPPPPPDTRQPADMLCFHTKEVHIASKADIIIQRYFSSKFTDIHCFVCAGPIRIKCRRDLQRVYMEPETGVW